MDREIFITKDGSHSLLHKQLNETYHSVHGAVQESRYVFIEQGLKFWWEHNDHHDVSILEIGFGTGLNGLLTLDEAVQSQSRISYATLEAYPLASEVWSKLNYTALIGHQEFFQQLHELSWNVQHTILPTFHFTKYYQTLQEVKLLPQSFDIVFYDAFAPSKQPEMWSLEMLRKVSEAMSPNGVFTTYCAKGQLKRDLKGLGLTVETLPGPPGKKEMIRAIRK